MGTPSEISPERGMKVTMMLADSATVADGKLFVLGGGWAITGPMPVPFAVTGIIEVPWHLTNQDHKFRLELIDLDGNPIQIDTPEGEQPLFLEGGFRVAPSPEARKGAFIPFPFAFFLGPVPLPTGSHFEWRLSVNGQHHEDWRLAFSTRPDSQSKAA
jgi:hypothetical protein